MVFLSNDIPASPSHNERNLHEIVTMHSNIRPQPTPIRNSLSELAILELPALARLASTRRAVGVGGL